MDTIQNPVQVYTAQMCVVGSNVISYPVVSGVASQEIQTRINRKIMNLACSLVFKQLDQLEQQGYKEPQISMEGWYEVKSNERGILSLTLGNYTFPYPAAHGLTIIKSLNFDLESGTNHSLESLFKKGSNYVQVLSEQIRKQIKEREIPVLNEFKQISPDQDYYIADRCLVLYFQLYDITPYAYGFPFFPISVYSIQDIIREEGPLGRMAVNT